MKTQILRKHVKLVAVMTLSLLCSHLWAQGSEGTGQWFRINLNDESKNSVHIMLSTSNGKHSIKSGMVPSEKAEGYTAFFVSDDGKYYIYEHDKEKNIINDWMEADTDIKNQAGLEKIYSYVKDLDFSIISDNGETYLKNVGYKETDRTALTKPFRTKNRGFDSMSIYNKKNGIFVLAVYPEEGKENVKIISFRDTKSFAEVNKDPALLESFIEWLKKTDNDKIKDVNLQIYVKVAQLIYKDLDECRKSVDQYRKYKFSHLYEDEENIPLRRYIQLAAKENKSVFYNDLLPEIANKYMAITKNEGDLFANKILNVEYSKGDIKQLIKDTMIDCKIWNKKDSSFDLEKHSIVVSDVSEARKGDIVLFGSYAENTYSNQKLYEIDYAVITDDVVCNELYGTNQTNSLGLMSVYKLKEKRERYGKKYEREICQFSELWNDKNKAPECVEIRRLLKQNNSNDIQPLENIAWNLFNTSIDPTSSKIEIGIMWESTQQSQNTKYRWIPNTGEYLILEQLKLTAKNIIGQSINGNDWKVILCGARDRCWEEDKSNASEYGNIYNNSECKFEIQVGDKNGELSKKSDSENYSIKWYKDKDKLIEDDGPEFDIKTENNLLYYGSDSLQINIRPENAKNVRPGDDLLLTFKIINNNETATNKKIEDAEVTVSDNDYIAVYDKKMLWRANLYINESSNDWNDEHPWNVPASGNDGPEWWDANVWGNNQWNRNYDLQVSSEVSNLTTLPEGNGKQVIQFSQWTPVRNKSDNYSENIYTDRVSYDYPHKEIGVNKHINAWDSPFDFIWKLNEQKKAIVKNFSNEKQNIDSLNNILPEQRKALLKSGGKFPRGLTNNKSASNYAFISNKSVESLASWDVTSSPDDRWRYYWKEHITSDNMTQNAYVVGLGLINYKDDSINVDCRNHYYNDVKLDDTNSEIKFTDYRSAGTDCIGFVQRTASYQNIAGTSMNAGRIYKWPQIDNGKIEENLNLDNQSRWKENKDYKTLQPANHRDSNYTKSYIDVSVFYNGANDGHEYEYMVAKKGTSLGPTEESFNAIKEIILKIIPGDIIQYTGSHIGTIESIDYNAIENANTIIELLKAINVIESCFSYRVNSLIIRNIYMGGEMLNVDTVAENITGAPKCSWLLDSNGKFRKFTIERLLSK